MSCNNCNCAECQADRRGQARKAKREACRKAFHALATPAEQSAYIARGTLTTIYRADFGTVGKKETIKARKPSHAAQIDDFFTLSPDNENRGYDTPEEALEYGRQRQAHHRAVAQAAGLL